MEQYIKKSALVAKIERRRQELRPTNTHQMKVDEKMDRDVLMWLNALAWVKKLLNTLEVKEVQEEPVSEDLKEAINVYSEKERLRKAENESRFFSPTDFASGFKAGAKWQKEQMMSKAIDAIPCSILGKEIIYTDLPKGIEVGDEVKVIIIKEELL